MLDLPTEADPVRVVHGESPDVLEKIPRASVDFVFADPPYPMIQRAYGMMTEPEWHATVNPVVAECRRVLKPRGSAVFVIQPNSERVGRMRLWWLRFMLEWGERWGIVQDAWWWNHTKQPTKHVNRSIGLLRPSLKACVWLGSPDCWRDQDAVLWEQSDGIKAANLAVRAGKKLAEGYQPSGGIMRRERCSATSDERGGVTPFNVLPFANTDSVTSPGANGHGAGTPLALTRWWVRYCCPPGGLVLDPFGGSGTTGLAAIAEGRRALLVEKDAGYVAIARRRIEESRNAHVGKMGEISGNGNGV